MQNKKFKITDYRRVLHLSLAIAKLLKKKEKGTDLDVSKISVLEPMNSWNFSQLPYILKTRPTPQIVLGADVPKTCHDPYKCLTSRSTSLTLLDPILEICWSRGNRLSHSQCPIQPMASLQSLPTRGSIWNAGFSDVNTCPPKLDRIDQLILYPMHGSSFQDYWAGLDSNWQAILLYNGFPFHLWRKNYIKWFCLN